MFEETEGKSIVTLVPAIFTERNTERKRKRCGKRGAMRKREKKGDCREKYMLVNKERLVSAKQYPTFCLLNKSKIYTVGIDETKQQNERRSTPVVCLPQEEENEVIEKRKAEFTDRDDPERSF